MAAAYGTREVQNRTRREVRTASVLDSRDPRNQRVGLEPPRCWTVEIQGAEVYMYIERSEPPRCWTAEIQGAKVNRVVGATTAREPKCVHRTEEEVGGWCEPYRVALQIEGV